jgi:uncharacterized protein
MGEASRTYVLVDGENIDATLGGSILNRRPESNERPRWDRLIQFVGDHWQQPVTGLFFINASDYIPHAFVQAVQALGFKPILLAGTATQKVVDIGIQKTLEALAARRGDVVLVSHDGDFRPFLEPLIGDRRVALAGFREFMNAEYRPWFGAGLELLDVEFDMDLFTTKLPRTRVIPIEEFDPQEFL